MSQESTQTIPQEATKLKSYQRLLPDIWKWNNLKTQIITLDISVIIAYTL